MHVIVQMVRHELTEQAQVVELVLILELVDEVADRSLIEKGAVDPIKRWTICQALTAERLLIIQWYRTNRAAGVIAGQVAITTGTQQ